MSAYAISDDKQLNGFFYEVVVALIEEGAHLHPPNSEFRGKNRCPWCQNLFREANWYCLVLLTSAFWGNGPKVNDVWRRDAQIAGFEADHLHETMLGVFVGGRA